VTPQLKVRIGITAVMAAFTLSGSAANLWHISDKAQMVPFLGALSVVAALDGLALVAAFTVHDDRGNWWGWFALVAGTLGSAGLQYAVSAPIPEEFYVPIAAAGGGVKLELLRGLHCLPTLATLVAAHLTITALPAGKGVPVGEQAAGQTGSGTGVMDRAGSHPAAAHRPPAPPQAAAPAADSSDASPRRAALDTGGGPGDRDSVVVVPPADTPDRRKLPDDVAVAELAVWLKGRTATKRRLLEGADELGIALGSSRAVRLAEIITTDQEGTPDAPRPLTLAARSDVAS
jgi:hypothetical protein